MAQPRTSKLFCAILIAGFATAASALGGVNNWTRVGPDGGQVYALAIDPLAPTTLWAGTPAGVFKSTDAGGHWANVFTMSGLLAFAVVVHPTIEGTVFAVERTGRPWKTSDGGTTWTPSDGGLSPHGAYSAQIVFKPGDPSVVYLVRAGGLFRSTDGGSNWTAVGSWSYGAGSLVVDPKTPANLWIQNGGQIQESTDGGDTWSASSSGLPAGGVVALAADPMSPETAMYAVASPDGGTTYATYKSTDGAAHWNLVATSDVLTTVVRNVVGLGLLVAPGQSNVLYASGEDPATYDLGLYKSSDSGATWTRINGSIRTQPPVPLAIPLASPNTLYAALGEGLYATSDAGATWQPINTGLRAMDLVYPVDFDPSTASTWYFVSPTTAIYKTTDAGATFTTITGNLQYTAEAPVAIDPANRLIFYTSGWLGYQNDPSYFQFLVRSADGGATWQRVVNPSPDPSGVQTILQVFGFLLLPTSPTTVYLGAPWDGVFKSTDGGIHFYPVNNGLPTCPVPYSTGCPNGPWLTSLVATDSTGDHVVVANQQDAGDNPYRTTNGGTSWSATSGMPAGTRTYKLLADPANLQTVYAGTTNGVYKSTDGGASWGPSNGSGTNALPTGTIYGFAIDSNSPPSARTIYAGGAFDVGLPLRAPGVYVSTDSGSTWSVLNNNYGLEPDVAGFPAVAIDPANHQHLILSSRGGLLEMTLDSSDPLAKGVSAPVESQVPSLGGSGTGDGNGDGIPDTQQANVASLPTSTGSGYVTVAAPDNSGVSLSGVEALPSPGSVSAAGARTAAAISAAPASATFPDGLVQFSANNVPTSGCVAVTLYFPLNGAINAYYKYGPTIDNTAPHWYNFTYDGTTGAEIFQDPTRTRVVLHLCDGKRGDGDVMVNGVIADPGGPVILQQQGEPIPTLSLAGLAVLAGLLALVAALILARRAA